jgi:hypothetical protein
MVWHLAPAALKQTAEDPHLALPALFLGQMGLGRATRTVTWDTLAGLPFFAPRRPILPWHSRSRVHRYVCSPSLDALGIPSGRVPFALALAKTTVV